MNVKKILGGCAFVAATSLITTQVVSQHHDSEMPDMQEMMQKWMELAQPGPEHYHLMKATGTWHQKTTHMMHPGAEPNESEMIATMRPIMGGRFMLEEIKGMMNFDGQDMPYEGMGVFGYDNIKQKHVYTWVDNFGTMIMSGEGTADPSGKVITYFSEFPNPMAPGGMSYVKSVSRQVHDDKHVFEMYEKQPDGTWFRNMEIVAKRP